jgi:hypothetical protein
MSVILTTEEAEIRRFSGQIVPKTLSRKRPTRKRAGGVAQGVGHDFKSQYHKKRHKISQNQCTSFVEIGILMVHLRVHTDTGLLSVQNEENSSNEIP